LYTPKKWLAAKRDKLSSKPAAVSINNLHGNRDDSFNIRPVRYQSETLQFHFHCLPGFSTKHEQIYSIVADGECHDSGTYGLGFYAAACNSDTNQFQLVRSGCTDKTCSECTQIETYSGMNTERGCMIDWSVNDLDKPGSAQFLAIADGECPDSGIAGLGYYTATCHNDDDWFQLSQSVCTDESCTECTGNSKNEISSVGRGPATTQGLFSFISLGQRQCEVEAFCKERVWSINGSCQRPGCSAAIAKWWPSTQEENYIQCIYSVSYAEKHRLNVKLQKSLLFDSMDECCRTCARVRACQTTHTPTVSPVGTFINVTINSSAAVQKHLLLFSFSGIILLLLRTITSTSWSTFI